MPIIAMQRKLREVGRIRIGEKQTNKAGKSFPAKLSTFRFTSRDRALIDAAAGLYGGDVKPWAAPDGSEQWDVVTKTAAIEVVVPPADMAFSQFFEQWSGGGCQRRCDGVRELIGDRECVCDPENLECTPHTRLSLMIPDLPVAGLFRLDTSGWNAAQELAGSVDLARAFAARGQYLPAELRLEIREQRKPGEQVKRFAVPCLDLKVSMRALAGLASGADPVTGEIPTGFKPVPVAALEEPGRSIAEQVAADESRAPKPARANAAEPIRSTGVRPRAVVDVGSAGVDAGSVDEAVGGGGPGPATTGSPPPSTPDGFVEARQVAMLCRDVGLDDEARHEFLEAFSRGGYASAKEVPAGDLAGLRAALTRYRRGEVKPVRQHDGVLWLVDTKPLGEVLGKPRGEPVRVGAGEEPWSQARWLAAAADVPGVGQVKLLRAARNIAEKLEIPLPRALGDVTDPQLVEPLLAWLHEQRAA